MKCRGAVAAGKNCTIQVLQGAPGRRSLWVTLTCKEVASHFQLHVNMRRSQKCSILENCQPLGFWTIIFASAVPVNFESFVKLLQLCTPKAIGLPFPHWAHSDNFWNITCCQKLL